jgi:hypothetical protein
LRTLSTSSAPATPPYCSNVKQEFQSLYVASFVNADLVVDCERRVPAISYREEVAREEQLAEAPTRRHRHIDIKMSLYRLTRAAFFGQFAIVVVLRTVWFGAKREFGSRLTCAVMPKLPPQL